MGDFQRSPSKVWWAGEEFRAVSASPGSQDSGFSDTEASPPKKPILNIVKPKSDEAQNLTSNIIEKSPLEKSLVFKTPVRKPQFESKSEPRYQKNHKVSRNIFRSMQMASNQYAKDASIGSGVTSDSWTYSELPDCVKTLPTPAVTPEDYPANLTAPAALCSSGEVSFSSDCDSELECLFRGDSPKHTSTPKNPQERKDYMKLGRMHAMNLLQKYRNERVPPLTIDTIEEGTALKHWMDELSNVYHPECLITLQCKSISGELAERVNVLASKLTSRLRLLLYYNSLIEAEFDNLKNQKKHKRPLTQSLVGIVNEFLEKFSVSEEMVHEHCEALKLTDTTNTSKLTAQLHVELNSLRSKLLYDEIKSLIDGLEDPKSELDVRAKLTGLTSITLHNEHLIEIFIECRAVQVVTTLCEKCEGSSVRALAIRALSTLCVNAFAIRKFESSGVQLITETLTDEARPEPERTEAVALLAQITAPWIEDNHNVSGLHKQAKRIVKYLTRMLQSTKCCQNILLCTAALANLTAMDPKSIKYLLHNATIKVLLEFIKSHEAQASIYLLEQVATLIANVSSIQEARAALTQDRAVLALMYFLKTNSADEEVMKRVHQKAIIGLSRLCGEKASAEQIVKMRGVEKLVELCRDKKKRFDSDAILVAALATLRKITEVCGVQVVNQEDAQELIQPRLLDSFMAYSAQNESLV